MKTIKNGTMTLLPPSKDKCQECATKHDPAQPHNAESLYYAMQFLMKFDRDPTWADAMAHCDENTKKAWTKHLVAAGRKIN